MYRWQSLLVGSLLSISLAPLAADEEAVSQAERAKNWEQIRTVAGSIRLLADPQRAESAVKLREEPVLRYADSTRQTHESSLWVWSEGGRPAAILAVEYYPKGPEGRQGPRWLYEIASLSTELVAAEREGSFRWAAKEPGLVLQPLSAAPTPAEKETRRLSQMKELLGRFTASESATINGRIELRPLVTPLLRYSDAKQNIVDGAIFALASGTNPEVLLVLEARTAKDKTAWHYALVQMTGEAVAVQLDGKEVWQCKGANPPAILDSYTNGWINTK